jgi:hypothetical protein
MPKVDQVRLLEFNNEEIGMGFNSDTGLAIGTALDFDPPDPQTSDEAISDVTIITSHESLMDTLNMSASAEGRYAFSHGSIKTSFSNSTGYNSTSTFVVARMVMASTVTRGKNFRIKPAAAALLASNQMDAFTTAFGDSFVRALFKGGEFYAVMRVTSVDTTTQTSLAGDLAADFEAGAAGAKFQAHLDEANKQERTHSEFFVNFYQKAGAGADEIGTTLSVDEIKTRLHNFPNAVLNHAFPYKTEIATYDTVPIPLPTKEQQEDFLLALQDADAQKLKFLETRNTLLFAIEKPEFFDGLPTADTLQAAANAYLTASNAAIEHAVKLSKGEISPPQLFDITKVTPPLVLPVIALKRKSIPLTPIEQKFLAVGGTANSILGTPVDPNEVVSADGKGRFKRFQSGGIFWHPDDVNFSAGDAAHVVFGNFYQAYQAFGLQEGPMGFPVEDQNVEDLGGGDSMTVQQFAVPNATGKGGAISGVHGTAFPGFRDGNVAGVFVAIPGVTMPA